MIAHRDAPPALSPSRRGMGCWVLAVFFIGAGIMHFAWPAPYLRIMPPVLPHPALLVAISGAAEIAGGLGLLFQRTRRAAAFGLALLLVAVWPANWHMAAAHVPFGHPPLPQWALWARVPLQLPLLWWALRYARTFKVTRAARRQRPLKKVRF